MTTGWIPIALGKDIPKGTTRSVLLDGSEIVIWRGSDGAPHVWEDRCPHRGMRLSFGFIRENSLNCLYHGWEYGAGSQCVRIPAHPDLTVPPSIRAKAYASVEASGLVWINFGPAKLPPPALPDTRPLISMVVDADPMTIMDVAATASSGQVFSMAYGHATLHVGWHCVDAGKTMLHAVIEGEADTASAIATLRSVRAAAELKVAA